MAADETVETALLALLKQPKSTQALRELMDCSSVTTEFGLMTLRDAGLIAYANGEWYKLRGGRLPRKRRGKKQDQRQEKLFDDE